LYNENQLPGLSVSGFKVSLVVVVGWMGWWSY
jgi:hypothetical protein